MIKNYLKYAFVTLAFCVKAQVKPQIQWVNSISQDLVISGVSSGIDGNSKVYVAGEIYFTPSNADVVVRCIDSTGAVQWTYSYDNGGFDRPNKIRVDAAGNTYVTGVSFGPTTNRDYVTIKLDNTGTPLWINRYDGGFNSIDEANDLKIDNNGDVYVTGKTTNSAANTDATTIKIDGTTGNILWQYNYDPNGFNDEGVCIVLADNQTAILMGGNVGTSAGSDIAAVKINASSGTFSWDKTFNGSNNTNDFCNAIILAGTNVVLCGKISNSSTGYDYFTTKINVASGANIFLKTYDFSSSDNATALVRDSTGNIAVTGVAYNSSNSLYEYHTLLYDSTGSNLWTHRKETNCNSILVDPTITCDTIAHHFYVGGEVTHADRDVLVYQLTPSGNIGWEKSYRNSISGPDAATSIVVNGIGVVFVSANTTNIGGAFDITTIKITQTPVYIPLDYGIQEQFDPNFVFQENRGQLLSPNASSVSKDEVAYYNQGKSPACYFGKDHTTHVLIDRDTILDSLVRVDMKFMGANTFADIFHFEPIDSRKHYFVLSNQGITDVRSYRRLFIPDIYPNTDLHHYSNANGLKSYFVFKTPAETMATVRIQIEGADSTRIDGGGRLIAYTPLGNIDYGVLTAYQATFNIVTQTFIQIPLAANWNSLSGNLYGISVSGYAPFWPVVVYASKAAGSSAAAAPIDNLHWATFVGDVGYEETFKNKTDAKDNLYISGRTTAINYPSTSGGFNNNPSSSSGQFWGVMNKFRNDGKLLYGTYYGGSNAVAACAPAITSILDVTVDSLYNIYIVGQTSTSNLITKTISVSGAMNYTANAYTTGGNCNDAFVAKLNPSGSVLRYASYWGGSNVESFTAVDYFGGKIFIGGGATSTNCPFGAAQGGAHWQNQGDGIYFNLDTSGAIIHNTKVSQRVIDADVDKVGNYYQVATTWGTYGLANVTSPTGFYNQNNASSVNWTLQRFATSSNQVDWATYIGGNSADDVKAIAIRDSIMAITGLVGSTNFPIVKSPSDSGEVVRSTGNDFVTTKFDLTNGGILWSAMYATSHNESPTGIAIDKEFNIYISGNVTCGTNTGTNTGCAPSKFKLFTYPNSGYYLQVPTGSAFIGMETFLVGYNSKNQRKWTTLYATASNANTAPLHDDRSSALCINNSGKLFMLGYTNTKNNTLPMVQWNSVCHFDNICADAVGNANPDGFIAMWDVKEFKVVGLKEIEKASHDRASALLFPNPNNGIFTLRFTQKYSGNVNINIMNIIGQNVSSAVYNMEGQSELQLNTTSLQNGIYFVSISQGNTSTTLKFIKD